MFHVVHFSVVADFPCCLSGCSFVMLSRLQGLQRSFWNHKINRGVDSRLQRFFCSFVFLVARVINVGLKG